MLKATRQALHRPTQEERTAQLERILASQAFQGAETLKAFLRFVVKKSLEGRETDLKEYTIATEVFGRNESYDPRIDSLVRVQAARLRSKLEDYYSSEGHADKVLINLPKGHYVPAFGYLHSDVEGAQPDHETTSKSVVSTEVVVTNWGPLPQALHRFLLPVLAITCLLLAALTYRYHSDAKEARQGLASNRIDPGLVKQISPFWGDFLNNRTPLLVAYSNAVFRGNLVDGLKYWVSPESSPPTLRPPSIAGAAKTPAASDEYTGYTGVGEVMGVYFLGSLFWKTGSPFRVERSLLVNWETVKAQNLVFLGGPAENLLLRRLPQEQDFVYRTEGVHHGVPKVVVLNRKPRSNERESYAPTIEGPSQTTVTEDYALISMLRGLEPNRRLLILSGITTFGTQACAEYVTKPEYLKQLIVQLNTSGSDSEPKLPPYYQVLLKVKINDSVPVQTSYVTHHVLD